MPNGQRRNASAKEVERIAGIVDGLLKADVNWIDDTGRSRPLVLHRLMSPVMPRAFQASSACGPHINKASLFPGFAEPHQEPATERLGGRGREYRRSY